MPPSLAFARPQPNRQLLPMVMGSLPILTTAPTASLLDGATGHEVPVPHGRQVAACRWQPRPALHPPRLPGLAWPEPLCLPECILCLDPAPPLALSHAARPKLLHVTNHPAASPSQSLVGHQIFVSSPDSLAAGMPSEPPILLPIGGLHHSSCRFRVFAMWRPVWRLTPQPALGLYPRASGLLGIQTEICRQG